VVSLENGHILGVMAIIVASVAHMEQDVDKLKELTCDVQGGMVTKLNARTSVVAAMNPLARYDAEKGLEANTGLPAPLLSRFDLVMVLMDGMEAARFALCLTKPICMHQPHDACPLQSTR
jgi:hypothetical protein